MLAEPSDEGVTMTDLSGKVALVTGASGGIGKAVARSLADAGVRLGLASRSGGDLGIEGAVAEPCDVRDAARMEDFVGHVERTRHFTLRLGQLSRLVARGRVDRQQPLRGCNRGRGGAAAG